MSETYDKNRIVKNSLLLYVRMLFTMWLNLWTTRLVLANLGVEDMGVYGVVGSVVSMFAVLTGGLTTATNRFLSYEMGREGGNLRSVFCNCVNISAIVAFLTFLLLEFVGVWFLNNKLQIPAQRMQEAEWVFHISVVSCIITVLSIPYNAMIVAKEKMGAFAFFSIIQVVFHFVSAYVLVYIVGRRLFWYAFFLAIVSVVFRIINQLYCRVKFDEARYKWEFSPSSLLSIGKFMGTNMIDSAVMVLHAQGIIFIVNIAYGVVVNAAYTVSMQVRNSVYSFSQNVQKAIEPQIIKNYATGDEYHFQLLVTKGALFETILLLSLLIPLQCRTQQILGLWLGDIPEHLCYFVKVIVFMSLISAITCPVMSGAFATGRVEKFLFVSDAIFLVGLAIYYICSQNGFSPEQFIVVLLLFETIVGAFRIFQLSRISCFSIKKFAKQVLMPSAVTGLITYSLMTLANPHIPETLPGLIGFLIVSTTTLFGLAFFVCFRKSERLELINMIKSRINGRG